MNEDKKPAPRRSSTQVPPMMSLRAFLRGGYQDIDEPTVVLSRSEALFTIVPGQIDGTYRWTPGTNAQSAPLSVSTDDPGWLKPKTPGTRRRSTSR